MNKKILLFIQLYLFFSIKICRSQGRYDVVIDEIMCDPTPQIGLPNAEWIELRNVSGVVINLSGWRVGNGTGTISGPMPAFNLQPDSCVIICANTTVSGLSIFGNTIGVTSFPSLDNNGGQLFLKAQSGLIVHAMEYNSNWYQNVVKSEGGWTLEMIDAKNPCSGADNWKTSLDQKGGTPGRINSVNAINSDHNSPRLLKGYMKDKSNVTLIFDEPLDSLQASMMANYHISEGVKLISTEVFPPLYNRVSLQLADSFQTNKIYTITVSNVSDCSGNIINNFNICKTGVSSKVDSLDIVINEVLFNPKQNGVDYVELYNRSNKIIDLKNMFIANRTNTGAIGSTKNMSDDNYLLFPGEYVIISEDVSLVKSQYILKNPDAFISISSMPSYPDDKGIVVLLNNIGQIIDELDYDAKWHFALIDNKEGVALERIDYNKSTNDPGNWTSAASTVGFGTPTYQNSQYRVDLQPQGDIKISPEIFSPDSDGFDDFALIHFNFPEPGYVANVTIYNSVGKPVKILENNTICSAKGSFRWDGLDDKQIKVPIGIYIIYTEIFNLKGRRKNFKNTVVVARKF